MRLQCIPNQVSTEMSDDHLMFQRIIVISQNMKELHFYNDDNIVQQATQKTSHACLHTDIYNKNHPTDVSFVVLSLSFFFCSAICLKV